MNGLDTAYVCSVQYFSVVLQKYDVCEVNLSDVNLYGRTIFIWYDDGGGCDNSVRVSRFVEFSHQHVLWLYSDNLL